MWWKIAQERYPVNKTLNKMVRNRIAGWRQYYLDKYGHACAITGHKANRIDIHHIDQAFSEIKDEIVDLIRLPYYKNINEYYPDEIKLFVDAVVQRHMTVRGLPISRYLHDEMNKTYGDHPTPDQLNEFIQAKIPDERRPNFERKVGPEPSINDTLRGLRVLNRYDKWREIAHT